MSVYSNIADVVFLVFEELNKSEDFLKLVSNDNPNALENPPTKTFNEMLYSRIWPTPFTTEPVKEKGTHIHMWLQSSSFSGANNVYEHDLLFNFVVYTHAESWHLNKDNDTNRMRIYNLLDIIESTLQKLEVSQAIRGKFVLTPPNYVGLRNEFCGYNFQVKITGFSSKVCK